MLKATEREKLQDCQLLIDSARKILSGITLELVPDVKRIQRCFRDADLAITRLLRA
jgi:hypothetical protein